MKIWIILNNSIQIKKDETKNLFSNSAFAKEPQQEMGECFRVSWRPLSLLKKVLYKKKV